MVNILRSKRLSRFSPNFCLALFLLTLVVIPEVSAQPPVVQPSPKPAPPAIAGNLEKLSVEELIDRLQDLTSADQYLPTVGWGIDYPHPNDPPPLRALGASSFDPRTPPVVRELLRRGVESLPKLMDRLEDKRNTKLVIQCWRVGGGGGYFTNEFDSRFRNAAKQPNGTVPIHDWSLHIEETVTGGFEETEGLGYRYTLKVGDLCYFLIGEMVNRDLRNVAYRDNAGTKRISSPRQVPALARACRDEWAGLTAEQHKAFLVEDGFRQFHDNVLKSPARVPLGALTRLYFYYPEEGEKRIIAHIKKPAYDRSIIDTFLIDDLFLTDKNHESGRAYSEFEMIIDLHKMMRGLIGDLSNQHIMSWKANYIFFYINDRFKELLIDMLLIKVISFPTDRERKQLLDDFRKKHGDDIANQIPIVISYYYMRDDIDFNILYVGPTYKSKVTIKKLFPNFNKNECKFINSIDKVDLEDFISALPEFSNKKIDQAIFEVFQQASAAAPDREDDHSLAKTCLSRLVGKPFDAQLRPYLVKRIEELKAIPDLQNREFQLKTHLDLLNQLKK